MTGMLLFGALGDVIGRRWGSCLVASIMLSGTILLTFAPLVPNPATYLNYYIFAATWCAGKAVRACQLARLRAPAAGARSACMHACCPA